MEFINKTESFFRQLQYCLAIQQEQDPQSIYGNWSLMLKDHIFYKLINDFNIEYPFYPENKIIELKSLMSKENISTKDALIIIKNIKKKYWVLGCIVIFDPVIDTIKRAFDRIDIKLREKGIDKEIVNYENFLQEKIDDAIVNYEKYLQEKRENIYIDLINEIQSLSPQQPETEIPTFTNNFDNIHPTEIYKYFKANLVEKKYLTEQELNEYLKAAFELKTIPETLFKIKDAPKKAAIEAVFYKYYKNVAGKIQGKKNQYAALLGDFFEGYKTTTVSSNFSKSVY